MGRPKRAKPKPVSVEVAPLVSNSLSTSITPEQYQKAWSLVAADCTVPQVMAATGLSKTQLAWLVREGDEARGMPAFGKMLLEQVAAIRARGNEAAAEVGVAGLEALKRQTAITRMSQQVLLLILQDMGEELISNSKHPKGSDERQPLHRVVPNRNVLDTIAVLRRMADFSTVAKAFRAIYDSPWQNLDPISGLPRNARADLSTESLMPAAMSMLTESKSDKPVTDIVDELLPELRDWSIAEVEEFASTGRLPEHAYAAIDRPPPTT